MAICSEAIALLSLFYMIASESRFAPERFKLIWEVAPKYRLKYFDVVSEGLEPQRPVHLVNVGGIPGVACLAEAAFETMSER
jgi:hypothetical protein